MRMSMNRWRVRCRQWRDDESGMFAALSAILLAVLLVMLVPFATNRETTRALKAMRNPETQAVLANARKHLPSVLEEYRGLALQVRRAQLRARQLPKSRRNKFFGREMARIMRSRQARRYFRRLRAWGGDVNRIKRRYRTYRKP